jgi:signal transduction histidine kinase
LRARTARSRRSRRRASTSRTGTSIRDPLGLERADHTPQPWQFQAIVDAVSDPILLSDPDGRLLAFNARARALFVAPADAPDALKRAVRMNGVALASALSGTVGASGATPHGLFLTNPSDGAELLFELASTPVERDPGNARESRPAVVTILRDRREALERSRLYAQLKSASDELERKIQAATADIAHQNELLRRQAIELEQASVLKSQFLANMSHEFRTPLNAMLGYTSMLLQGVAGPLGATAKRHLARVESNGRNLLTIINEILDISRIEAGRMPLQQSRVSIPALVDEVRSELEAIVIRSRLRVQVTIARDVRSLTTDRQKLKQILLNLLSNALKFTHTGTITISARRRARARAVELSVTDTGIGIAPADHERIFEDFRQLDNSSTRPYGGTGLGLSICRRLAHMLGGSIVLESEPGVGSTFALVLPLQGRK